MSALAFVAAMTAIPTGAAAAPGCTPRAERFALPLPGAVSRAEIVRPEGRIRGLMVLIHGSDVADLDNSVVAPDGVVVATPLRDVATAMACVGIATIRYDKRFVSGAGKVDRAAFAKLGLRDLLADAALALRTARTRRDLAHAPVLIFGWSEGTTVAAAVAAVTPGVRGVILQAPVVDGFASVLQTQFPRVGMPYMLCYAASGALDAAAIARAKAGPGGLVAQIYVHMFEGFAPGERINPLLDRNHDGSIDVEAEAAPVIRAWFADGPDGGLGMYATGVALPGVRAQLPSIRAPVLILQGEADGNIDPAAAASLAKTSGVTVRLYPGLGHTLGRSASPLEDAFAPIAPQPLADMAAWAATAVR